MSRQAPVLPPPPKYVHCKCPHCKLPLDYLECSEETCPRCHNTLVPDDVWNTRTYDGVIILPPWLLAFTWPLALMVLGAFIAYYASIMSGTAILSIGLVYFVAKITLNSRDV